MDIFKPLNIRLWALRQLTKAENREIESIEKQYTVNLNANAQPIRLSERLPFIEKSFAPNETLDRKHLILWYKNTATH